jgi:hypothetical protein
MARRFVVALVVASRGLLNGVGFSERGLFRMRPGRFNASVRGNHEFRRDSFFHP